MLYCDRSYYANFDSARQSQIEAQRSERGRPFPVGKADEEDRFGKVAASQNSHNLSGSSITSAGCFFFGIGTVLIWGPSTTAAILALPKDLAAVASGGSSTVQEIGGTVGLTIIGTIFRMGHPQFMIGFRYGLWALIPILVIGLLAALPLYKQERK